MSLREGASNFFWVGKVEFYQQSYVKDHWHLNSRKSKSSHRLVLLLRNTLNQIYFLLGTLLVAHTIEFCPSTRVNEVIWWHTSALLRALSLVTSIYSNTRLEKLGTEAQQIS